MTQTREELVKELKDKCALVGPGLMWEVIGNFILEDRKRVVKHLVQQKKSFDKLYKTGWEGVYMSESIDKTLKNAGVL